MFRGSSPTPQLWRQAGDRVDSENTIRGRNARSFGLLRPPSIFKWIIQKQAAVNFDHRLFDEKLGPLLPFGTSWTIPMTRRVTLDTWFNKKSQPPGQSPLFSNPFVARGHSPATSGKTCHPRSPPASQEQDEPRPPPPATPAAPTPHFGPLLPFYKLCTTASAHMFVQCTRRFL